MPLGPQPVSSHFAPAPSTPAVTHDLALGVCTGCGVVQLLEPFPYRDLAPQFDWITYREPEDHLDEVVDKIVSLPGVSRNPNILGLSFKDRTTLERLGRRGRGRSRVIDAGKDLSADDPNAGIETVQALLTPDHAAKLAARFGAADLLVARHIVEHAEQTRRFMLALDALLAPGGHAVIEVPACSAHMERMDYTMIWEEHVVYFTLDTLPRVLAPVGWELLGVDVHPYAFEDILVLYARKREQRKTSANYVAPPGLARDVEQARRYGVEFDGWTRRHRVLFEALTGGGRRLAAYGAGHLTCAFLNFHDVADYFAFVVDDTPRKQGLYLPGSGLPIVPRDRLKHSDIALCLLGFTPEIEDKVIANNPAYDRAGGRFASMFVDSPRSIRALLPA